MSKPSAPCVRICLSVESAAYGSSQGLHYDNSFVLNTTRIQSRVLYANF